MKKLLNKIAAMLLTGVMAVSILPLSSFAATGTDKKVTTSRRIGQVTLYQDGALSDAYQEEDWTEQYTIPEEGTLEGDFYKGLIDFEKHISLTSYHLPVEEVQDCFQRLINSNPELFFVSNGVSYFELDYCDDCEGFIFWYENEEESRWMFVTDLDPDTGKIKLSGAPCDHAETHKHYNAVYTWTPKYITNNQDELVEMKSKFDAAVENALAGINEDMSELDKALYFHDYIVKSNTYDYDNFMKKNVPDVSHSAYGALVNRVSVCDGYALAYSYLLKRCGIETRLVTSSTMEHAWSAVKLGDDWYFVDCTGDDPVSGYSNKESLSDRFDSVSHENFLMSVDLLKRTQFGLATDENGNVGPTFYNGWAQTDLDGKAKNTQYDKAVWRTIADKRGDVNMDGQIDADDALAILKYKAHLDVPIFDIVAADTTGEGVVDADDALAILKFKVGTGEIYSGISQKGITNEYGYCNGAWYYLDDATFEIMKTDDPTKAGDVYSSIIKEAKWPSIDNPEAFYVDSFGKASVYAPEKTMYVSTEDTVYKIDLTGDGEAVPYLSYSDLGNTTGAYIYGLTVIDDTLYIGIANDPYEKESVIEKPIG